MTDGRREGGVKMSTCSRKRGRESQDLGRLSIIDHSRVSSSITSSSRFGPSLETLVVTYIPSSEHVGCVSSLRSGHVRAR